MNATSGQFRTFIDSLIWKDMVEEIDNLTAVCLADYQKCEGLRELGQIQGRLSALAFMKDLPGVLMEDAQMQEEAINNTDSEGNLSDGD